MVLTKFCVVIILIETLLILLILSSLSYKIKNIKMSVGILTWVSRAFLPFPGASFKMMTGTGFLLIVNFNTWFLISGNFIYPLLRFLIGCQPQDAKFHWLKVIQGHCRCTAIFSLPFLWSHSKITVVRLGCF